jgi:hypothetical protein
LSQDNCDLVDIFKVGDKVTLAYNLRGIEWVSPKGETKWFNTLEVWKMNYQDETMKPVVKEKTPQETKEVDSLPF